TLPGKPTGIMLSGGNREFRGRHMSRIRVRWLVAALLVFAMALTALWWFYLRPPYGISQRRFAKIQKGMTLEEVETIIGFEPGMHCVVFDAFSRTGLVPAEAKGFKRVEDWIGPEAIISVYLDANEIVLAKEFARYGPESPGFLSKLLEMLGL